MHYAKPMGYEEVLRGTNPMMMETTARIGRTVATRVWTVALSEVNASTSLRAIGSNTPRRIAATTREIICEGFIDITPDPPSRFLR